MAILLRTDKGSKLTHIEADENFSSLFYSASIDGNTLFLYYTGSQFAPSINPITIDIPQGSSYWTEDLDGSIYRNSAVRIVGNTRIVGAVSGSTLKLTSLPVGTTETRILVADGSGNVRYRTDLQLQGPQGTQGSTGAQGIQGIQGTRGIQGIQGLQGVEGDEGVQGIQGIQGPQGTQGVQGLLGLQGIQGPQGTQGVQGTQGIQGIQGLQGLQGIQGIQGPQGTQGIQGIQGLQGLQGIQGIQGPQGTQGIQGIQGIQGTQGIQGPQGTQGIQGIQGIQGFTGDTGTGFTIAKVYSSVAALQADTTPFGIVSGQFALIDTSDVEDADNSKIYLWNGSSYVFINDLSGTAGIQGVQGIQGISIQGIQGIQGLIGPGSTITNNVNNYVLTATGGSSINGEANLTFDGTELYITGKATATAGFFNSSDIRLKDIDRRDGDVVYFRWKDGRDTKEHIGYIAQEQQIIYPDQISTSKDDYLTVNYIEILVAKIRQIEKEIELLKGKL